jgi:uncharacterized protein YutE (UPF0331/DUF86 family)
MEKQVIENKLESLRRCIDRIQSKKPESLDALTGNYDLQDILSVNLERAVKQCVDIGAHIISDTQDSPPETMGDVFDNLRNLKVISDHLANRMRKAVGFRNIAVHTYQDVAWEIVYQIVTKNLIDFIEFARSVSIYMESQDNH